jgi:small subunit ribosomal protein S18
MPAVQTKYTRRQLDNSTSNDNEDSGPKRGRRGGFRSSEGAAKPKRVDEFAVTKTKPDYRNYEQLRRYVNAQGKILPRRRSGLSAKNQRLVARAIKRARHLALLPIPGAAKFG